MHFGRAIAFYIEVEPIGYQLNDKSRYNMRESGRSRRLKNKDEWIVVEDNHPAIIDKAQFQRVNQLHSDNYRGLTEVQHADIHKHIFSKILYCGNCNAMLSTEIRHCT